MLHDVFISYSTEDKKIAEELSAYLEKSGIRCFFAYRDIPKGIDWAEIITSAIEKSKLMVIVFSDNFNRSKQVDREITLCVEENKPILTFKIQNVPFVGTKKYYLQNLNWVDAFPNPEKHFETLRNNVLQFIPEIPLPQKQEQPKQKPKKEKSKKSPKNWYYLVGGIVLLIGLFIWLFTPKSHSDNPLILTNDTTNIEILPPITTSDTSHIDTSKIVSVKPEKITVTPEKTQNMPKETIKKPNSEENIINTEITFTVPTTLTSTSDEQFAAIEGDIFKGKMKGDKVVQGNVIRDGKTVKTFLEKRNH